MRGVVEELARRMWASTASTDGEIASMDWAINGDNFRRHAAVALEFLGAGGIAAGAPSAPHPDPLPAGGERGKGALEADGRRALQEAING